MQWNAGDWIAAVDTATDPIFVHDEASRILWANRAFASYAGCRADELIGRDYREVLPTLSALTPDEFGSDRPAAAAVGDHGIGGAPPKWSVQSLPIRRAHGKRADTLCLLRPTAPVANAAERRYQALIEHALDFVVILGGDGRMQFVNPALQRVTGYTPEEMTGRNFIEFVHPDDVASARETFARSLSERDTVVASSFRYRIKDGSWRVIETLAQNLLDTPEIGGIIVSTRDVTERVRAQAAERRLTRALRMLSGCNSVLVHAGDERTLLNEVCRLIVAHGQYPMSWVGLAKHDDGKSIEVAAYVGAIANNYGKPDPHTWSDADSSPTGSAIRERKTVVTRGSSYRPSAVRDRRLGGVDSVACIAIPIVHADKVFGALTIHAATADAFDMVETRLLEELAADLGFGLARLRENEMLKRLEQEVEYGQTHDSLTDLPNRHLFEDRVAVDLLRAGRSGLIVAVLSMGIDRFQVINDSFGRGTGDALLRHVGQGLAGAVRKTDTAARLSGDEFAVCLSDLANVDEAATFVRRLQSAASQPIEIAGHAVSVDVSIGIAVFPKDGSDAGSLLRHAEGAMHDAKSLGGNGFRFYAAETNERVLARYALEIDLRRAIGQSELEVHYQPKVSLATGAIIGAEALLRWHHPARGMLPPGDFIPVAEATGLINSVGEWVLNAVCRQIRAWRDAGMDVPAVAVNLSAHQFRNQNLVAVIEQALRACEIAADKLELEITESTLMGDIATATATLGQLRDLGVKLSLDDFGTGYSSLSYLKRLPIDALKVDQSFVRDITRDPDDAAICLAVIDLAHNLGLRVIAEGVETDGQLNYLRRHGCDEMQGYLFAHPMTASDFAVLLEEKRSLPLPLDGLLQRTILLVDDEPSILSALRRVLRPEGYRILTAGSGSEGLEVLAQNDVHVVLADHRMVGMSGIEFLERTREIYPETVRVVITGYADVATVAEVINRGAAYKFLTKPWEDEVLRETVRQAFAHFDKRGRTGAAN